MNVAVLESEPVISFPPLYRIGDDVLELQTLEEPDWEGTNFEFVDECDCNCTTTQCSAMTMACHYC
ncbi:MAG: hypothetical protein ACREX3_00595 [Gammaproteobacteria bacterium]